MNACKEHVNPESIKTFNVVFSKTRIYELWGAFKPILSGLSMNLKELKKLTQEKLLSQNDIYEKLLSSAYAGDYMTDEIFGIYYKTSDTTKKTHLKTMYALLDVLKEKRESLPDIQTADSYPKKHLRISLFKEQDDLEYYHIKFSNNWRYGFRYMIARLDYKTLLTYPEKAIHDRHFATVELLHHICFCIHTLKQEKSSFNAMEKALFSIYRPLDKLEELRLSLRNNDWQDQILPLDKNLKSLFHEEEIELAKKIYAHLIAQL